MQRCIFCDIVTGNVPASVVHRDERCIAFMDITPITPGHLLVIPIAHAPYLADLEPTMGGHLFSVAEHLAAGIRRSGLRADGFGPHYGQPVPRERLEREAAAISKATGAP